MTKDNLLRDYILLIRYEASEPDNAHWLLLNYPSISRAFRTLIKIGLGSKMKIFYPEEQEESKL